MRTLKVLSDYEIRISAESRETLAGELLYFTTNSAGQTFYYEIGTLVGWFAIGDCDAFRSHWKVRLFLDDKNEYDSSTRATIIPNSMSRADWQQLRVNVADGPLPAYRPELPDAIVRTLLQSGICEEPVWAQVFHCRLATVLDNYGELGYDDD